MSRQDQLISELTRAQRIAQSIEQRLGAHFALHRAACLNNDVEEMKQRREDLHIILDTVLDNGENIQRLADELERLMNR